MFSEILTRDQLENGGELADFNVGIMSVTARRDWVYEDAFAALNGEHGEEWCLLLCWRDASHNTLDYCIGGIHLTIH